MELASLEMIFTLVAQRESLTGSVTRLLSIFTKSTGISSTARCRIRQRSGANRDDRLLEQTNAVALQGSPELRPCMLMGLGIADA